MPHIRLHHQSEYEPLLPISPVAAATVTADNDKDIDNDNGDTSSYVENSDINDDSMVPIPLPDTPEGRVVSCTGSGEGECAILIAARQIAKHWLPQRLSTRARARSVDPMSLLLLATNSNNTNGNNTNSNSDLEDIDFDDDGWNQFEEGSAEVAPSQTAQSNLTAPNQETDIEIEKRSGSRGDSNGVVSRGSSRGGSSSSNGNGLILSKRMAQRMLMIVLPQADRTLLTALKHEHFLVRQQEQKQGRKIAVATGLTGLGVGVSAGLGIDKAGRGFGVGVGTGALCLTKVRTIFTQLLDATAHMHDKGYLHGDVCPMNIGKSICQPLRLS